MNRSLPIRPLNRSICSSITILALVLFLAISHMAGSSARSVPAPDADSFLVGQSFPGNHPNALLYTPEGDFTGANGQSEFMGLLRESFSNIRFDVRDCETAGDLLIIEFTMSGIHDGVYLNLGPQCASVSVDGMAILELGDLGVTRQWISYDQDTLVAQIDAFSQISPDSRPTCDSMGIDVVDEEPVNLARPACMVTNTCFSLP